MKILKYFLLLSMISCASHEVPQSKVFNSYFERQPASLRIGRFSDKEVIAEVSEFQTLVEELLVWRARAIEFAQANEKKLSSAKLTHEDIQKIHSSALAYVNLRKRVMDYAYKYQEFVKDGVEVKYVPGEGSHSETMYRYVTNKDFMEEHTTIYIDPTDEEGEAQLIKAKLSLNAALVLYDSYMTGLYPFYKSKKMRKILNTDIKGHNFEFDAITDSFFDYAKRLKMHSIIKIFKKDLAYKQEKNRSISEEESYLNLLAIQSPFYAFMTTKYKPIDANFLRVFFDRLYDRAVFMNDLFTFTTSALFGNTVGLVATRKGYLSKLSASEQHAISTTLKPLDILLEKTPFRLTDQFIPGHYGHVAVWVGNETELRALGIWDHPSVAKYHKEIQSGHQIIEALRPGVQINTLKHFLNIDDLLALRDNSLNDDQRREFLLRAFDQVGKDYDFNFDVETDKKIVCSEIVYVIYHNIDWPTKKTLGRYTISPDHVVSKVPQGILTPVLMYTDGKKVENDMMSSTVQMLLGD